MDVAGTSQARSVTGASKASRGERERKVRRNGEIVRDRDVPDIFEKLIEESNESEESQQLVGKDQEQGRDDVHRQPPPPSSVSRSGDQPRIDLEA
ncbi:MAG: hypothetical protein ACF8NJ_02715 [Phycisphaerales bacterium JB038]